MQRAIKIQPPSPTFQKGGIKPVFALYKERKGPPVIVPANGATTSPFDITQTTLRQSNGDFKQVFNDNGVVNLLDGTAFSVRVTALDPNKFDPWDNSDLHFKWRKDGTYLHTINNLNSYKGFNVISFAANEVIEDITGNYTLEVTNLSGTTTVGPLQIIVHNRIMTPKLYGNLIANSSGEKGLDNWNLVNGITVSEFAPGILESKNFGSINIEPVLLKQNDEFISTQPELPFRFCSSTNWISFNQFYQSWKSGNPLPSDYNWWYANVKPNLVSNEDPSDEFACFFPSKRYIDEYNDNGGKFGLMHEMQEAKTYFTKTPVERDSDPISKMTQEVDIADIAPHVDGKTCGIDNVVGNFFAYVGLGISSYKFVAKFRNIFAKGPADDSLFRDINNVFWDIKNTIGELKNAPQGEYGGIGNKVATRAGETNPYEAMQIPIIRDLYFGRLSSTPINTNNDPGLFTNSAFKQLFNYLLTSNHPTVVELPGFIDVFTNDALYSIARNNMPTYRATIAPRIQAVVDLFLTNVVQPLNQYFNLNLSTRYADLSKTEKRSYDTLWYIITLLCSNSIDDIQGSKPLAYLIGSYGANNTPFPQTNQLTRDYFKAVNKQKDFDTDNQDIGIRYGERFNFAYAILQFLTYEQAGGAIANDAIARPADPDKIYNTLVLDFNGLKQMAEGGVGGVDPKVDFTTLAQLDVYPICNDTVNFEFEYYNEFNELVGTDNLAGPNEDDIFAVKERAFLSTILTKLFQKTSILSDDSPYVPVTYKGDRKLFTLYKFAYGDGSGPGITLAQDFIRKAYPPEYFDKLNQLNSFPSHDQGAAAFFAVNKKLYIPKQTRRVLVTAVFDHKSIAWGLEADSGLNRYAESEIQAEHLTDKLKFYRSGRPRVGLAHVKLSLHDNTFKRTLLYPNYFVPQRHVWSELKAFMTSPLMDEYDRILYPTEGDWQNFAYVQPTRESLALPVDNTIQQPKPDQTPQPDVVAAATNKT